MSLSHLIALADQMQEPRSPIYDFGLGVHPHVLHGHGLSTPQRLSVCPCASPICPAASPICPAGQMITARRNSRALGKMNAGDSTITNVGKDGFQVCMDVTQFKPSELNVKVVDNFIVIEGKHEERQDDHGHISRQFVRRYALPKNYESEKVMSSLSSDGVLTVNIPKPQPIGDKAKERVIQIQQVGPAHLNIKQNGVDPPSKLNEAKATNGSAK